MKFSRDKILTTSRFLLFLFFFSFLLTKSLEMKDSRIRKQGRFPQREVLRVLMNLRL